MALMERVATLLRANINDLLDRAEDPEKVLKQLVLDMQNQLLQVKTQVAIALADQHLLERRVREQEETATGWHRSAELAVSQGDDGLARAALERAVHHDDLLTALRTQVTNQAAEAESVRASYATLQTKLVETEGRCEVLLAEHRRSRMLRVATEAAVPGGARGVAGRLAFVPPEIQPPEIQPSEIQPSEIQDANTSMPTQRGQAAEITVKERFAQMERDARVEERLSALKDRQQPVPAR